MPLDFLRGLSIFGMVLSAIQPHGVMPGWMYHVQNPPPTHDLNMGVPGIGWVDMVFPIFIFCMGASIPFAKPSVKGVFARFGMLWLFSYVYVLINSSNPWVTLAGFAALFPLYMVFKSPPRFAGKEIPVAAIRVVGALLVGAVIWVNHHFFAEVLSVQRRGIIIFLLAFLYLFGSLIWLYTQEKKKLRWGIWLAILAFTIVTQQLGWPTTTYANPAIRWWFNVEYFYFLLLLIPSTFVGELIKERAGDSRNWSLAVLGFALVVWLLYAFYMQLYWWNVALSGVMLVGILAYAKRVAPQWGPILSIAAFMVYAGVLLEPYGGGIKKVPCTIQYCFAAGGMAMLLLVVAERICRRFPKGFVVGIFEGAGKNPLMSYIAFNCMVMPIMQITGAIQLYRMAYPQGMHVVGFVRSVVAVLFTMWIVGLFTRKKIFWKA
jgi:hypothetical protein